MTFSCSPILARRQTVLLVLTLYSPGSGLDGVTGVVGAIVVVGVMGVVVGVGKSAEQTVSERCKKHLAHYTIYIIIQRR